MAGMDRGRETVFGAMSGGRETVKELVGDAG